MIQAHLVRATVAGVCLAFDRVPEHMDEWRNAPEFTTGQAFTDFLHLFTARLILESQGMSMTEVMQD